MIKATIAKVFTHKGTGGNKTAVVFKEKNMIIDGISLAKKLEISEVVCIEENNRDLTFRFYTPEREIDLCGHATLGALKVLKGKGFWGEFKVNTRVGKITVGIFNDLYMNQVSPKYYGNIDKKLIAKCLGVECKDFLENMDVDIVSTGVKDAIVPLRSLEVLNNIKVDLEAIKEVSKEYEIVGFHVFTLDTIDKESSAHCRNFAPLYGIDEEAATGTSNCALACYLYKNRIIEAGKISTFEQGNIINSPSRIQVCIKDAEKEKLKVMLSGEVILYDEIYL
ncbi:PhzF family phenazine biosynthesis protein [Clostridium hydrogeniformans]|uniref:PhzF family phenazine biosynthesis protein n=1 Tax=Clostridium hydrogeniformans TaxID=349933 RepID=UPI0006893743|nr:PhzF family phenazine biosynthesis protein [Clostridium hydrogeniformans]